MINILEFFSAVINSYLFLFIAVSSSFVLRGYIFFMLMFHSIKSKTTHKPFIFLSLMLAGSMFVDLTWLIWFSKELFYTTMDKRIIVFFLRLSWAATLLQYQSLALFIESLLEKNYRLTLHQKIFLGITSSLSLIFIYPAFFKFNCPEARSALEYTAQRISSLFFMGPLMLTTLSFTFYKMRTINLPKLLKKQVKIVVQFFIFPYLLSDFIQVGLFALASNFFNLNHAIISISSPLLTYAVFYCSKKIIGLRFVNFKGHVESVHAFNFIDDFKNILEQLSHVTSINELSHISQTFFKDALQIAPNRTALYIRKLDISKDVDEEIYDRHHLETIIENFISYHKNEDCHIAQYLKKTQILIADEIAFSNFYEESKTRKEILEFLTQINADVFLPIYEKQTIIAYIIIEQNARANKFYSSIERDEMLVFASYLSNIINLLKNRNLNTLIQKEKEMREELYNKHQEINQYKESIRSFLRDNKQRKIGIIFYKNRRFTFGNQSAKELINTNINADLGHPITKALRQIAQQVEAYKSGQTCFAYDHKGNKLVLSAIPNVEQNNIIITVYYPEISDIIKQQIDLLHNPSEWDYLLYLETTKTGQLINQLIPARSEQLMNFKIELIKIALIKKALLLEMPEEDLLPTVEILHHISLREALHILNLQKPEKGYETAIKLFGINPIFGNNQDQPLLEKLDNTGTLFIQNVHLLGLETQQYLAEFIKYGFYHMFKSDQKVTSNVRIICSTTQNLQSLIQVGKFSKSLFNELKKTTLTMPSLLSLPEQELDSLMQGFTEQALQTNTFKHLLELTNKDKDKLIHLRPVSLQEFKNRVQQLLVQKSKKNNIYEETQFDVAYNITDPALIEAAKLGKKALKDPKIMSLLWQKFQNQNKIASFLNVNRSSVNRRCKEYNLI